MTTELRYWMRLIENQQDLLYHATRLSLAIDILKHDRIKAYTGQVGVGMGVSLTKSWTFAETWKDGVVFSLRRAALPNELTDYRWQPHHGEAAPGDEQEVFAVGDIRDLRRVLQAVTITRPSVIDARKYEISRYSNAADRARSLAELEIFLHDSVVIAA